MPASRPLIVCLLAALMCLVTAGQAQAQDERPAPDPEAFAQECLEELREVTQACARRMTAISERTVDQMEELIEDGHPRRAVVLGNTRIREINLLARRCSQRLQDRTQHCVRVLNRLGAEELAEEVGLAGRRSLRALNEARVAAVGAIREAMPEPPADGDE